MDVSSAGDLAMHDSQAEIRVPVFVLVNEGKIAYATTTMIQQSNKAKIRSYDAGSCT